MIQSIFGKIFGTRNDRLIKRYKKRVEKINSLEPIYQKLSDAELQSELLQLRQSIQQTQDLKLALENALEKSFAITREASKRILNMRHFDVQLIGNGTS